MVMSELVNSRFLSEKNVIFDNFDARISIFSKVWETKRYVFESHGFKDEKTIFGEVKNLNRLAHSGVYIED